MAEEVDQFVMTESAVRSLPPGYAFADAEEHAAEREACAQECEKACTHHGERKGGSDTGDAARRNCAARIRDR